MARSNTSENQDDRQFPRESRRSSKSSSETRTSESEFHEIKNSGSGRYEKTSRESEHFEARSRSSESYEAGLLAPGDGAGDDHAGGGGTGGGGTGGGGDSGWQQRVPPQVRISLAEVQPAGQQAGQQGGQQAAPSLAGDYILDLQHRGPLQCRWTLGFPPLCGFDGLTLTATPAAAGQLELRARFTGKSAAPQWRALAAQLRSLSLHFDHAAAANPCGGCRWPESVLLTPLGTPEQSGRSYIPAEPTAAERAAVAATLAESSSAGPSPGGNPPAPEDLEPPVEEGGDGDNTGSPCEPGGAGDGTGGGCANGQCSTGPVRYFSGELQLSVADVSASGFGDLWQHRRIYSNRLTHAFDFGNGFNWQVRQWAYLLQAADGTITVVRGGGGNLWFDPTGAGGYRGRYGAKSTLTHDAGSGLFLLRSPAGTEDAFHDFDQLAYPPGLFARHTSQGGQVIAVTAYTLDDRIGEIQRSLDSGGSTTTESFRYEYFGAGPQHNRLQSLTLRRRTGSGPWENIQRARYEYYDSGHAHGSLGDLKLARQQEFDGAAWQDKDIHYYRYWKAGDANGFEHGLKYVLEPESFAQLAAITDPFSASDAQVSQYADYYYEYDSQRRVNKETVQAGALTYSFAYTASSHADNYNHWARKTVETQPDGSQNIVYMNYIGAVLVKELKFAADRWIESRRYDANGRQVMHAQPSAVTGYNESAADLDVSLRTGAGLIELTEYYSSTGGGGAAGYRQAEKLQQGSGAVPVVLRQFQYTSHTAAGATVHRIAKETVNRHEDGSGALETSYSYSYHSGTVQVAEILTTLPPVPAEQNGAGSAATRRQRFDLYGNLTWIRDERGTITRQQYDIITGALTQRIEDVDSGQTPETPSGWSTPSGGGLHLVSDYEHDVRGRTTQELGPVHTIALAGVATSVRRATWYVYSDVVHETRTAQGFLRIGSGNYTLINPVSITQRDGKGHVRQQIQAVRASTAGRLTTSDSFAQSSYVRWTTYQYSDCCTLVSQRVYHAIPSSGEGSAGTHYHETQFGYNSMKRRNRTVSPGGTIRFEVLDVRGQTIASYVGTDDSGGSESDPTGSGASGNDMLLLRENQYDGGSDGGDGNLTRVTQYVDDTTTRVTQYLYDWRNRQTATDGELDFYEQRFYDNLDRVVMTERRDTTASGQLLSRDETLYDNRGRIYRTIRHGVDPDTGSVTGQQTQDRVYDAGGNLLRQEPAGEMEYQLFDYDSLGRRVAEIDPLEQTRLFHYDAASNLVSMTDQNEEVWARGYDPLGRLVRSTNPLDESTTYGYSDAGEQTTLSNPLNETTTTTFDAAGRRVSVADPLGKITFYTFDANGNETSVTDPNNLTTISQYDYLDRLIKVTDPTNDSVQYAYNLAGELITETDAKDQQTTHAYDALGRRVSTTDRLDQTTAFAFNALGLQASLSDAENQTTQYVYDHYQRLYQTIWPDHVPGSNPGDAGYGITQAEYDDLNRVLRTTDQLGDTVTQTHDAAGRLLSRDYRTRANSPSGTIADSDSFSYDATSKLLSAVSGRYSNTVALAYDAAGRKVTESLTISGQTYTSTTQYDAAGRVSRLTYPNGGRITRTYTARGQLATIVTGSTVYDTRLYDHGGRLVSSSYNNGVSETRSYNDDNTLASISYSGAAIGDLSYSWDANKNKTSESISGIMSGYGFSASYDAEDRLAGWVRADSNLDQSWELSPVGDWDSITENSAVQNRTHGAGARDPHRGRPSGAA